MFKKNFILATILIFVVPSLAQIPLQVANKTVISSIDQYLIAPKWSPNGNFIAAAGENYVSIWLYTVETETWKKLVEENGAGWDFDWSPDSKKIAFRANVFKNRRKQTAIKYVDISAAKIERVTDYKRNLSTPKWVTGDALAVLENDKYQTVSVSRKALIKIESTVPQENISLFSSKGILTKKSNAEIELLEPLKGQIFDVSFSPNGTTILFRKPGRGIFALENNTEKLLAEGEMPAWSSDGNYVVFARTKDDGYRYISSDIFILDTTNNSELQLTNTANEIEMRPHWSPVGNKIVCDSNGKIILINLEKEMR